MPDRAGRFVSFRPIRRMTAMMIRRLTVSDFGTVGSCDIALSPEQNYIQTNSVPEISAAIAFLLCSKARQTVPAVWLRATTRLTAEVLTEEGAFTVTAACRDGALSLAVTDGNGTDVTNAYQNLLTHCPEQDAFDSFDGMDKTISRRLCWYRNCADAPENVSRRTGRLTDTKSFRSLLLGYIRSFRPEPIHCEKDYLVSITPEGRFEVIRPGVSGGGYLSETEEKLFLYICFLNLAEFWAEAERIRDMHHEKKPLVIRNFLEFLDEATDVSALAARTARQQRQVILLAASLDEDIKTKWIGKENPYGVLFKSGNGVCSD